MADITGTDGDDVLNGTRNADTIEGGAGDDIINSGAGDDIVSGGDGDDQLHTGSGDDTVDGGEGNDQLDAGAGDDTLIGGAGDDFLNGGGGSDTYVFNFTVNLGGETTLTYDLVPQDYDTNNNGVSQNEFSQFANAYVDWLDANAPADYEYDFPQPDPLTSAADPDAVDGAVSSVGLTNGQTRYWEPEITVAGGAPEITASDGNDTIAQFQDAGPNVDTIVMNGLEGLSDAQLDALFDLSTIDTDGIDGDDATVLSWNGGSISILGTIEWGSDVLAFFHDDRVQLA